MSAHESVIIPKKPLPASMTNLGWGLTAVGGALAAFSYATDAHRALFNNVIGFTFLASIAVGALFFIALEYIAGAVWTTPFRRVIEFLGMLIIPAFLLAIPILLHLHEVYHWASPEAAADAVLKSKASYLNEHSFMMRFGIFFALWFGFYALFRFNSMKQDKTSDQKLTKKNIALAAAFIPVMAISISLFSIDWVMSLEPHWFSTMFGVYFFTGSILTALSVITYFMVSLSEKGYFFKGINENHYYSFGALIFGLLSFWAYIAFSQFMLIWYANLPEENYWYIARWQNGWEYVSIALTLVHFWIPYFMLVSRPSKMNTKNLKRSAALLIFAQLLDLYWLVVPTFSPTPLFGYQELAFPILGIGIIIVLFSLQAKSINMVPVGDPKLQRGIDFHL